MTATIERIEALDDKDALNVAQQLTTAIMAKLPAVESAADLPPLLERVAAGAGVSLKAVDAAWFDERVATGQAGTVARELLRTLAATPQGAELVSKAIDRFPAEDQDLGLLSIPIAAGLFYIAVVSELDVDLGWFKLRKPALSGERQVELGKSLLPKIFGKFVVPKG